MPSGAKVAAVLWMLAEPPAAGGPAEPPVPIDWEAPETCPKQVFVDRLESYLDQGVPLDAKVIRARAHVEDRTRLWHLDLEIERQDGTSIREFSAQTCETVADAGAFVLAVAIEPGVRDRHEEPLVVKVPSVMGVVPEPAPEEQPGEEEGPPEAPAPAPDPTAALEPAPTEPTLSRRRKLPRIGLSLAVLGGVDLFAMPGVGGQFRAVVGVKGRHWRADLVGDYRFATEEHAAIDPEAGGRFTRWAVGARGCGLPLDRPAFQLPLCAGIEGGQVVGRGIGLNLDPAETSSLAWVAPTAAAAFWWLPIEWLGLGVELGLSVPVLRHDFGVDGIEDPVHTLGPVAFSPLAGVLARLR